MSIYGRYIKKISIEKIITFTIKGLLILKWTCVHFVSGAFDVATFNLCGDVVVKQNGILKYLEFSWIFYLDIYFFEQYQESQMQLVSSWRTFI